MNIVTIRQTAESIAASNLAGYVRLPFEFDIEENDSRHLAAGYSVVWGQANEVYEVDQVVNIVHDLHLTITKRAFVRNDDDKIVTTGDALYTALEPIIKSFVMDKINLPAIIQRVELTGIEEPKRIGNGRDVLALRASFRVRYLLT